jgi:hypothetical protein
MLNLMVSLNYPREVVHGLTRFNFTMKVCDGDLVGPLAGGLAGDLSHSEYVHAESSSSDLDGIFLVFLKKLSEEI